MLRTLFKTFQLISPKVVPGTPRRHLPRSVKNAVHVESTAEGNDGREKSLVIRKN